MENLRIVDWRKAAVIRSMIEICMIGGSLATALGEIIASYGKHTLEERLEYAISELSAMNINKISIQIESKYYVEPLTMKWKYDLYSSLPERKFFLKTVTRRRTVGTYHGISINKLPEYCLKPSLWEHFGDKYRKVYFAFKAVMINLTARY